MSDISKLSETDKAYFAGLVDVGSSVQIERRLDGEIVVGREIVLRINGLTLKQVQWVKARFKHAKLVRTSRTDVCSIYFVTRWAATALAQVMEHIIAKEAETRLVFRFADSLGQSRVPLTAEQKQIRAEVDRELTALKRGA